MDNFKLYDRVKVLGKNVKGEIAFFGDTHFADGVWYGIILDEAKGQNNGSVEGKRYFKCPRNHGIFVKASKIKKESEDSDDGNDKLTNIPTSSKSIYPNYLKSSSKLKSQKHQCQLNSNDVYRIKSKEKKEHNSNSEIFKAENNNDVSVELQSVKRENEDLKQRLKDTEKRLQESIEKYTTAMDKMKHLKVDLDFKKKQINNQKCHLKLLKMRQCNHYKKVDSLVDSNCGKNSSKNPKKDCLSEQPSKTQNDTNFSDDEFDLENMKALTSMRRIVELEEENRIMIEGLVELREFLKSRSHFMDMEIPPGLKIKNIEPCSSSSTQSPIILKTNGLSMQKSELQHIEYKHILREMIKFSEIIKERRQLENDFEKSNTVNMQPPRNFSLNAKEEMPNDDNVSEFKHQMSNETLSNSKTNKGVEISDTNMRNESLQKTSDISSHSCQNFVQIVGDHNTDKSFNLTSKMKDKCYLNNNSDNMSSNTPHQAIHSKSSMVPSIGEESQSNIFLNQQELASKDSEFASNYCSGQSESDERFQRAFVSYKRDMSLQSSGDNNFLMSLKEKETKRRRKFANPTHQTEETGKVNNE